MVLSLSALEVGVFLYITAYGEMQLRMDFLGMEIPMKHGKPGSFWGVSAIPAFTGVPGQPGAGLWSGSLLKKKSGQPEKNYVFYRMN